MKDFKRITEEYPDLEAEDIRECLRYAAASAMSGNCLFRGLLEIPD